MENRNKIGVITHPTINNYGGILQAYALQTVLNRLGYESEVIEKCLYPEQLTFMEKLYLYPLRFIKKYILRKHCPIRYEANCKELYEKNAESPKTRYVLRIPSLDIDILKSSMRYMKTTIMR